jgi:hypothetical protein
MHDLTHDLVALAASAGLPGQAPSSFGGKCDLLAADGGTRLLTVEVKPRGVGSIVWSPAQAIVYARLLTLWLGHDRDAMAILNESIEQRRLLGLIDRRVSEFVTLPQVVPMVAVQRGMSNTHRERLFHFIRYLRKQGVTEAQELEIHEVTLAGRMTRIRE